MAWCGAVLRGTHQRKGLVAGGLESRNLLLGVRTEPPTDTAIVVIELGQKFLIGRRPVKFREIALAPCPVGGFLDSHALGVDQLAETVLAPGEILAPASRVADPGSGPSIGRAHV